jgi:hypothetical protein
MDGMEQRKQTVQGGGNKLAQGFQGDSDVAQDGKIKGSSNNSVLMPE